MVWEESGRGSGGLWGWRGGIYNILDFILGVIES